MAFSLRCFGISRTEIVVAARSAERVHLINVPVKAASKFGHQPPNFMAPEGMPQKNRSVALEPAASNKQRTQWCPSVQ
jgi:hypothetical protein